MRKPHSWYCVHVLLLGFCFFPVARLVAKEPTNDDDPAKQVVTYMRALASDHNVIRRHAAKQLSLLGENAKPAVPALVLILKDTKEDQYTQEYALDALRRLGPAASEAIPVVVSLLRSKDAVQRRAAANTLGSVQT